MTKQEQNAAAIEQANKTLFAQIFDVYTEYRSGAIDDQTRQNKEGKACRAWLAILRTAKPSDEAIDGAERALVDMWAEYAMTTPTFSRFCDKLQRMRSSATIKTKEKVTNEEEDEENVLD